MCEDFDKELKEAFPKTPEAFTSQYDAALKGIQDKGKRWKAPVGLVSAYALAACAFLALVFVAAFIPSAARIPPATQSPSASPMQSASTAMPIKTAAPLGPVPRLPVSDPGEIRSSDGWQAVAADGIVRWYYNPKTQMVARTDDAFSTEIVVLPYGAQGQAEEGETLFNNALGRQRTSYALGLAQGQSVDTFSFLPSGDGRWVAFTVHGKKGDSVWIVSEDGEKMAVPEDVQWVDSAFSPVAANFSGASMEAFRVFRDDPRYGDQIIIRAAFADGDNISFMVFLNAPESAQPFLLNDRRGLYYGYYKKNDGSTVAGAKSIYPITKSPDGKYSLSIGGNIFTAELKDTRFSLFKISSEEYWISNAPIYALIVYENDPDRTLWLMNLVDGKAEQVAKGCQAAGWGDNNAYWYSAQSDSAAILKRSAPGEGSLRLQIHILPSMGGETENGGIYVRIENLSGPDVTIPATIPCSLQVSKDGQVIWSAKGFNLDDAEQIDIGKRIGDDSTESQVIDAGMRKGPIALPAGYILDIIIPVKNCSAMGEYSLDGYFYNNIPIHYHVIYSDNSGDNNIENNLPSGVSITGKLSLDRRMIVKIDNNSRATYQAAFPSYGTLSYPLKVYYRLLSGGKVIDNGEIRITQATLTPREYDIPPGESRTFMEPTGIPRLADLQPGDYRLECCYCPYTDSYSYSGSWGNTPGYYFNLDFTVQKQ